jgi:hypothetical protein
VAEFVTVGRSDEIGENEARSFQVGGQMVGVARVSGALLACSRHLYAPTVQLDLRWRHRGNRDPVWMPRQPIRHEDG